MSSYSLSCELPEAPVGHVGSYQPHQPTLQADDIMTMFAEQITRRGVPLANECQLLEAVPGGTGALITKHRE